MQEKSRAKALDCQSAQTGWKIQVLRREGAHPGDEAASTDTEHVALDGALVLLLLLLLPFVDLQAGV